MTKPIKTAQPARLRFVQLNSVTLSGHLTHDPVLKVTKAGVPCLDFQLGFNSSAGESRKRHFVQVAVFGDLAVHVAGFRKGLPVIVEGEVRDSVRLSGGVFVGRVAKLWAHRVWRLSEDERQTLNVDVSKPAAHSKPPPRKRAAPKRAAPKRSNGSR